MLLFDVAAICVLFISSPLTRQNHVVSFSGQSKHKPRLAIAGVCSTIGLAAGLMFVAFAPRLTILTSEWVPAQVSGHYLVCHPAVADVGVGEAGGWHELTVAIHNRSGYALSIIGAERSCRCRALQDLPIEIAGGQFGTLQVQVQLGESSGIQHDRFWLITTHPQQPLLLCRWQASVIEPVVQKSVTPVHDFEQTISENVSVDARAFGIKAKE